MRPETPADDSRSRLRRILVERSMRFGEFVLASGKTSDYYIDGKYTTLHPEGLACIAHLLLDRLPGLGLGIEAVGGVTIGGDPIVGAMAALGHERGEPIQAFLIRKESKDHGTKRLIEGVDLAEGTPVAIVEDVVSTGGSALRAVETVRATGAKVVAALAVVDRSMGADAAFEAEGIRFEALFTKDELLEEAERAGLRPAKSR